MNIGFKTDKHITKRTNLDVQAPALRSITASNSKNYNFNYPKEPSFKGKFGKIDEVLASVETEIGPAFKEILLKSIEQASSAPNPILKYDKAKGTIEIEDKGLLRRTMDLAVYPVKGFPLDVINATVGKLSKIPGLDGLKRITDIPLLKNRSLEHENIANTSAVENYILKHNEFKSKKDWLIAKKELLNDEAEKIKLDKEIKKLEEAYKSSMVCDTASSFDLSKGNYDSTVERGLTRAVTGIVPAFFLANDAYNLSIYMNDDKKVAKEAKKKRFNQELIRIALTAASTYGILKIFSKKANNSAALTAILIGGVTFISEVIGRQMVGTPVIPVSEKRAKEIYTERKEKRDKNISAKLQDENTLKDSAIKLKDSTQVTQNQESTTKKPSEKKNILTMENVLKGLGGLILLGLAQDKLFKLEGVKKLTEKISKNYKGFLQEDKKIKISDFNAMLENIKKAGLEPLAQKYQKIVDDIHAKGNLPQHQIEAVEKEMEKIVKEKLEEKYTKEEIKTLGDKVIEEAKNGIKQQLTKTGTRQEIIKQFGFSEDTEYLHLGKVNHKIKTIIVDQILMFPIKYTWTILSAPYAQIVKPLAKFIGDCPPAPLKNKENPKKDLMNIWDNYEQLSKKAKGTDIGNKFTDLFKAKLLSSMNTETKSGVSNAELAALIKNVASTTTSAFLIVDNYNMVMIDSEGQDKELAAVKTKERTLQRLVRIIYGAFIIKLCNNIFSGPYNGSLLGAQTVNAAQTYLIENLERKSVGLPTVESNKKDIIKFENKNLQATGLKGGYFRAMAKLTGHRGMAAEAEALKNKKS